MRRDLRSPNGSLISVYESPSASLAFLAPPDAPGQNLPAEFVRALLASLPRWDRDAFDPVLMGGSKNWTSLACTVAGLGGAWSVVLAHPRELSVTKSLIALEDEEQGDIHPTLAAVFIQADRGLRLYREGKIPLLGASFASLAAALAVDGLYASLVAEDALLRVPGPLPPPLMDGEPERMVRDLPLSIFDTGHILYRQSQPESVREALLPRSKEMRRTDLARWMLAFARYLWSDEWWHSTKMRAFAHSKATVMGYIITMTAKSEAYLRPLPMEIRGVRFLPGAANLTAIQHESNLTDPVTDWYLTVDKLWPQVIEWYAAEIAPEVLRAFLNRGVYRIFPLGVDMRFELEEDLIAMRDVAKALLDEAEANAFYVPNGYFTLALPDHLRERILRIRLDTQSDFSGGGVDSLTGLLALDLYASPDGLWVRLSDGRGNGPIIYWQPGRPPMDNMLSESFVALLDAILSAIWRDLRVAGETSVIPRGEKSGDRHRRHPSAGKERKQPSHRPSNRAIRPVALPRRQRGERLELKGRYEWSSAEERERIKIGIRGIPGRPRRLPEGRKASAMALARASEAGIIVPAGHTFVRPYTRGVYVDRDEDIEYPRQDEDVRAMPILSKGLATLVAFIGEPDES